MISIDTAVFLVVAVIAANACVLFLFNRNHKKQRKLAAWLSITAASRAAARIHDVTCECDEARKRVDQLAAQNSSTEAKSRLCWRSCASNERSMRKPWRN